MAKSLSTAKMKSERRRFNKASAIVSFLMSVALFASSCSLGSMPSKTSSMLASDIPTDTTSQATTTADPSSTEETEDTSLKGQFQKMADEYMDVLRSGDVKATSEIFGYLRNEILPAKYDCDEQVFSTVFKDVSYFYGPLITADHSNYDLEVTMKIPDIRSCEDLILEDEAFLNEAAKEWVQLLCDDYSSEEAQTAFLKFINDFILEAGRRISEGEYTETLLVSGTFRFHDNGEGNWLITKTPEFVRYCTQDYFMNRISYIDDITLYYIIQNSGKALVEEGTITQEQLDNVLLTKKNEILSNQ